MLKSLMEKFVKQNVIKNATNTVKLLGVEYEDKDNHMDVTKLIVGFLTERALEHVKNSGEAEAWVQAELQAFFDEDGV